MPGSPKGKKKLSKTEKEKLKQEEEELKRLEDEEEQRRKVAAASEKQAQEKLEAEERNKFEVEENKRRFTELLELNEYVDTNVTAGAINELRVYKESLWERYMRCDGSPDPTILSEINTYINLALETNEDSKSVQEVLDGNKLTLKLIDELLGKLHDSPEEVLTDADRSAYYSTLLDLQRLVKIKCDIATHKALLRSTELMNSETLNLQETYLAERTRLYLWGNLSKNPRIKQFEFENSSVGFDIPKVLTLSDCVYRMFITEFDHLSHTSKSFNPFIKEAPPADELLKDAAEKLEGVAAEQKEGDPEAEKADEEKEPEKEEETATNIKDLLNGDDEEDGEGGEKEVEEEPQEILDDLVKTPELVDYEDFDGDEHAVDLRAYNSLGGVMYFNLLHMPPQPKSVITWTITQVDHPAEISYMEYVADEADPNQAQSKQPEEDEDTKKDERPVIQAMVRLPNNVYFCEEPQVARWDEKHKQWRQDGFQDISYVDETRRFSFKTSHFGTFCLLQDTHGNMPFQSWEIRPRGQDHCLLTLIAAIVELQIEVKDDKVMLTQPSEPPELGHLRNKWLPFKKFKKAMIAAGLNIFPNVDSQKYVTVVNKSSIVESRLYRQIGLSSSVLAFSWSKWNLDANQDKIILQGTEHLKDVAIPEDDWKIFMVNRKRVVKLKMTEFDEKFSAESDPAVLVHADMYHMAQDVASAEGKERIAATQFSFAETVNQLLASIRPLVFS